MCPPKLLKQGFCSPHIFLIPLRKQKLTLSIIVVSNNHPWIQELGWSQPIYSTSYYTLFIFWKWHGDVVLHHIRLCTQLQSAAANEESSIRTSPRNLSIVHLSKRNPTISSDNCLNLDINALPCGSFISCESVAAAHPSRGRANIPCLVV